MADSTQSAALVKWLLAGVVLVAFVCVGSVALPRQLHVIPVLALASAGLSGLLLGLLARSLRLHLIGWGVALSGILAAAGQLAHTLEMHRRYAHNFRESHKMDPLEALLARAPLSDDPEKRREMEAYIEKNRREREAIIALRTSFPVYLQERLAGTRYGRPTSPVAWSVFSAEILFSGLLAAGIVWASLSGPSCPRCRSWYSVIRRRRFKPPQDRELLALLPCRDELDRETATVRVYVSRCACLEDGLHVFYEAHDKKGFRTRHPRPIDDDQAQETLCRLLDATPRSG